MILADGATSCPTYHLCLTDYLHTQFDPAHLLSELGFTILFDLIILFLLWGKVIRPWLAKKVAQEVHDDYDKDHGITHHEDYDNLHPATSTITYIPTNPPIVFIPSYIDEDHHIKGLE